MPQRPCIASGCPELAQPGRSRCAVHEAERQARRDAERTEREPWRAIYSTDAWRHARTAARRRACFRCEYEDEYGRCLTVHGHGVLLEVHHVTPLWAGGDPYSLDNLIVLCPTHHRLIERQAA